MKGEGRFFLLLVVEPNGKSDAFIKGVTRFFADAHRHSVCHGGMYSGRSVDECRHSVVGGGIPQILNQFRPGLVHVASAAGITAKRTEE